MCPKPKLQRIYNKFYCSFRASELLTAQRSKAWKCCVCHVTLLDLLLQASNGAREQHVGTLKCILCSGLLSPTTNNGELM